MARVMPYGHSKILYVHRIWPDLVHRLFSFLFLISRQKKSLDREKSIFDNIFPEKGWVNMSGGFIHGLAG
jgi:hypothetical protein